MALDQQLHSGVEAGGLLGGQLGLAKMAKRFQARLDEGEDSCR